MVSPAFAHNLLIISVVTEVPERCIPNISTVLLLLSIYPAYFFASLIIIFRLYFFQRGWMPSRKRCFVQPDKMPMLDDTTPTINATNATVTCGLSLCSEVGYWLHSVTGSFRSNLNFAS